MVMNNQDLERLSAAMDGELNQDLGHLLGDKRHDEAFQDHWFMFHLIGDVLRDDTIPHALVHPQVSEALKKRASVSVTYGGSDFCRTFFNGKVSLVGGGCGDFHGDAQYGHVASAKCPHVATGTTVRNKAGGESQCGS